MTDEIKLVCFSELTALRTRLIQVMKRDLSSIYKAHTQKLDVRNFPYVNLPYNLHTLSMLSFYKKKFIPRKPTVRKKCRGHQAAMS